MTVLVLKYAPNLDRARRAVAVVDVDKQLRVAADLLLDGIDVGDRLVVDRVQMIFAYLHAALHGLEAVTYELHGLGNRFAFVEACPTSGAVAAVNRHSPAVQAAQQPV